MRPRHLNRYPRSSCCRARTFMLRCLHDITLSHAFTQSSYRHWFSFDPPPCSYVPRCLHDITLLRYSIYRYAACPLRR
ncbi:hypothetical protein Bca52824_076407 [Brassica carinata]|uniref:Uncharacterized protein n=1 Tax=Brassica carinata TaxID=52824 RepID=A0A8X7PTX3_BRACI|nr:hypothetical protein Bca52824_076407 [Brassica carinata]